MEEVIAVVPALRGSSPEAALEALIGVAVRHLSESRTTLGVLIAHMPGVLDLPMLQQLEEQVSRLASEVAWISPRDFQSGRFKLKMYILTNAVFGFLIRLATTPDPGIPSEEITVQIVRLITGYLEPA